jgi:hypothetical protein
MDGVCDLQICSECLHWMAAATLLNASVRDGKRVRKQSQRGFRVLEKYIC